MDYQPEELLAKHRRQQARRILAACGVVLLVLVVFVLRAFHVGRSSRESAPISVSEPTPSLYSEVDFAFGRGYIGAGWGVYFNEPDGSVDQADYADGIDSALARAIDSASDTLDIAAFELSSEPIHNAIARAAERGVTVRSWPMTTMDCTTSATRIYAIWPSTESIFAMTAAPA